MNHLERERSETLGTLKAALCEPNIAAIAWRNLCSEISFMELTYRSIRLFPAIYKNLSKSNPMEIGRLRGAYRRNWTKNQLAWFSYLPLIELMNREKVNYVIGKGFAVAVLLGDLGIRQMGDLDIYALKRDEVKIRELISKSGFSEKYSKLCSHGLTARVDLSSHNYINHKGHEIDLHLVDFGSDYLHRKLLSEGHIVSAFGKNKCRIPSVELMLIKSLRHGAKQISISDYVQSAWDVAQLLKFCDESKLREHISRSGDGYSTNRIFEFLRNDIGLPLKVLKVRKSKFMPIFWLRNFQYQLFKRIHRFRNPIPLLLAKNQLVGRGNMWALWRSFGSLRPIERLVWKWHGGFLDNTKSALKPGEMTNIRGVTQVAFSALKDAGEIRIRAYTNSKIKEIELFGVENFTASWLLFINGVLFGSIPIAGVDRYIYPLNSSKFEISLRNFSVNCSGCMNSAENMRILIR